MTAWISPRFALGACLAFSLLPSCVPDPSSETGTGLKKLCEAQLRVQGSFTESRERPQDVDGCWPVGTWTFSATLDDPTEGTEACPEPPSLLPEYRFEVMRDDDDVETYKYLTDPEYTRVRVKVTSGGGGLCEGGLELYSQDGSKVLNFKPGLQADKTIRGFGEYEVYDGDHW